MIKMTCSIRIDYSLGEPTESKIFKITRKKTNKRKKKKQTKEKNKNKRKQKKKKKLDFRQIFNGLLLLL